MDECENYPNRRFNHCYFIRCYIDKSPVGFESLQSHNISDDKKSYSL
nr:MAG TPA: hypothetical protein [Caudoviricetes sp.]